jgi:hypothetical protein
MFKYTARFGATLALAAIVGVAGCKGDAGKQDTSLAADSALNRDLALANAGDSAQQPQLQDVPANPPATTTPTTRTPSRSSTSSSTSRTPTTSTRTPTESRTPSGNVVTTNPSGSSSGGGKVGTIAAGTQLVLNSSSRICTNTNKVGDKFTATVANAVTGTNGAVIPAGATVTLTVTALKRSENVNDKIVMEFAVNSVTINGQSYPLDAAVQTASIDRVRNQPAGKDAQKVATGAIIGAIAGQVIGKNTKSTVIGGAAGAAAGAATAAATANYEGCVPDGGQIVVQLNSSAQIKA